MHTPIHIPSSLIPVTTDIPDTSIYIEHLGESVDEWAFRYVTFYALALPPNAQPGQLNEWKMKIAQIHVHTKRRRFLELDLTTDMMGSIIAVNVRQTDGNDPTGTVMAVVLRDSPFYIEDKVTKKNRRVEYYHYELMMHLRNGVTQRKLLHEPETTGIPLQYYLNVVSLLQRMGVVSRRTEAMLKDKVNIPWTHFEVPYDYINTAH